MPDLRIFTVASIACLLGLSLPAICEARDRADRAIKHLDRDGDGRIGLEEWQKNASIFRKIDADGDGYIVLEELRSHFESRGSAGNNAKQKNTGTGLSREGEMGIDAMDRKTVCAMYRNTKCGNADAIEYGLFETGLEPRFPDGAHCPVIDEPFAVDFTARRATKSYHGGIDIPAPTGTPIRAAANGTVVAKYDAGNSARGYEIILRHTPKDTGLPYWIYTQYTHFHTMPDQQIGQRVRIGEELGPTGNSGLKAGTKLQNHRRRPAIHFAAFYTKSDKFVEFQSAITTIIPVDFRWMDPVALYRKKIPLDSRTMKDLPEVEKHIPVAVMFEDGEIVPADAKIIWPYTCKRD